MQKLKWKKSYGGKFHTEVTKYNATTEDGYRAEFESYRGCHRKVCEWMVWYPNSGGQDYGVCYDLDKTKRVVAKAIEDHRTLDAMGLLDRPAEKETP